MLDETDAPKSPPRPADSRAKRSQDKELTIFEHLDELRGRLIKSAIAVGATTVISFSFAEYLLRFFVDFAQRARPNTLIIYTEVTEYFGVWMRVAIFSGIALAMPVLVYQFVMFLTPALTTKERRYVFLLLPGVVACFAAGVAFGYLLMVPRFLEFLLTFGEGIATPQIKIGNFVSFVTNLLLMIGAAFETPIVIWFLAAIGVVTAKTLMKYRRFAILGAFVVGAIITPTIDPVNQTVVSLPIYVLYEIGIWLAVLAGRARARRRAQEMVGDIGAGSSEVG